MPDTKLVTDGYVHENPTPMTLAEETKVMEMGLEALARIGVKPRVYRSPYWDFSPNTLSILEQYGFSADSSLMGNDFHPYVIRQVETHADKGNVFGRSSKVLEIPVPGISTIFLPRNTSPASRKG